MMNIEILLSAALLTPVASAAQVPGTPWERWLERKLLPVTEGEAMIGRFLESQLQPLPLPSSRDTWLSRRDALRREVLTVIGLEDLLPAKWDLAVQLQGTLEREGYRIQKMTFQSYPGLTIPALLYIPNGLVGRAPGIVSISGHTKTSKAADYVQQRNVNLVLRGCVVLSYDYLGLGDRITERDSPYGLGRNAHGIRTFSFSRRNATTLEVLDAVRAIDVLAARPEVDPHRIGFTGESGGSNSTYWVSAVDERVKLTVPVSSVTTYDYWIRTNVNWDWHQRPPGIRRIADIGTLLALHAPNPLLIISSKRRTDDQEFPLEEAEKSFQWARHVYHLLESDGAASHYESITAHGYQEDKREQLYLAVERWLKPARPHGGKHLAAKVESEKELRCVLPEDNLSFHDVFREWVKPLPRPAPGGDPAALRGFLRERLGWPQTLPDIKAQNVGKEEDDVWSAEFWIIETEPGIRLPAVHISPKGVTAAQVALIPGPNSRAVRRALEAGRSILFLELRGRGETRPEKEAEGSLNNWAWFAGRPLAGQWALDLVQAARFCQEKLRATVSVEGERANGWSALLAGAAAPEHFASGRLQIPWASLHENLRWQGDQALADVPGLLEYLDIPQIRALWPAASVDVY